MPRYNQNRYTSAPQWFEKLPRKGQILLLLCITVGAAAIEFLMGLHSVHTGRPIVLANRVITAPESFLMCLAWLAISGGLLAVLMGWVKGKEGGSPP